MLLRGARANSPLVARPWRNCLDGLRHPADHRTTHWRCGADIVDRRLCRRVWRTLACAGLPAPFKARSAIAEGTGRREESLSPNKRSAGSFGVTPLGSKCDNLQHADRALAR